MTWSLLDIMYSAALAFAVIVIAACLVAFVLFWLVEYVATTWLVLRDRPLRHLLTRRTPFADSVEKDLHRLTAPYDREADK